MKFFLQIQKDIAKELYFPGKLTVSKNCMFLKSGKKIVKLNMENNVRQPIFDQSLQTNPWP